MATASSENLSSEVSPEVTRGAAAHCGIRGAALQAVLDEALREYIERKEKGYPRQQVMAAFEDSLREFDLLYRELSK